MQKVTTAGAMKRLKELADDMGVEVTDNNDLKNFVEKLWHEKKVYRYQVWFPKKAPEYEELGVGSTPQLALKNAVNALFERKKSVSFLGDTFRDASRLLSKIGQDFGHQMLSRVIDIATPLGQAKAAVKLHEAAIEAMREKLLDDMYPPSDWDERQAYHDIKEYLTDEEIVEQFKSCYPEKVVKEYTEITGESNLVIRWKRSSPSTKATFSKASGIPVSALDDLQDSDVEQADGTELWMFKHNGKQYEIIDDGAGYSVKYHHPEKSGSGSFRANSILGQHKAAVALAAGWEKDRSAPEPTWTKKFAGKTGVVRLSGNEYLGYIGNETAPTSEPVVTTRSLMDAQKMLEGFGKAEASIDLAIEKEIDAMLDNEKIQALLSDLINAAKAGIQLGIAQNNNDTISFNKLSLRLFEAIKKKNRAEAIEAGKELALSGHGGAFGISAKVTANVAAVIIKDKNSNIFLLKEEFDHTYNLIRIDGMEISTSKIGLTKLAQDSNEYAFALNSFKKKGLVKGHAIANLTSEEKVKAFEDIVEKRAAKDIDDDFIDLQSANAVLTVLKSLSGANKEKYLKMSPGKMAEVAWKLVGKQSKAKPVL